MSLLNENRESLMMFSNITVERFSFDHLSNNPTLRNLGAGPWLVVRYLDSGSRVLGRFFNKKLAEDWADSCRKTV